MLRKIISGGQTGVDRAALDVALELGISCGGWCPKGRLAEDGRIPGRYPLTETPSNRYQQRTERNVRDADATLVITRGPGGPGTEYTLRVVKRLGKPHLVVDLADAPDPTRVRDWIRAEWVGTLNVAGPRESNNPGIYEEAKAFLLRALRAG